MHDPIERHELEKRFSKERALVDLRLKRENKNIEEKVRNYEMKLRLNKDIRKIKDREPSKNIYT